MPVSGRTLSAQLVWPVVALVLTAVLANVAFAAWLATRSAVLAARAGRERIVAALDRSRIALVPAVVEALGDLTGSDLVVWDDARDEPAASTLRPEMLLELGDRLRGLQEGDVVVGGGRRYAAGVVRSAGVRPERVVVLTPVESLAATSWRAAWPVLAVAAVTLGVLVPVGLATTGRIARRISAIERRVDRISGGDFAEAPAVVAVAAVDEVDRLDAGVERMRCELQALRERLVGGERERLLGQLAAGFAHELRNAITGAKLAIDLHRRRCPGTAAGDLRTDDSLAVAGRQLDIVEEEVRGLLALGKPPASAPQQVDVDALAAEVRDLVGPRCGHAGVTLALPSPCGGSVQGRRDGLRAALVNLALNAIDAAGRGGHVMVAGEAAATAVTLVVEDDGPGPPAHLGAALHEPFVTGKPEGIGLGLTVARSVAEQHGGTLDWRRVAGRTRFEIRIPVPATGTSPREQGA
ncbi:MAG: sensor histidine kinase [Planctomycetaceae bacterium]